MIGVYPSACFHAEIVKISIRKDGDLHCTIPPRTPLPSQDSGLFHGTVEVGSWSELAVFLSGEAQPLNEASRRTPAKIRNKRFMRSMG